MKYNSTQKIKKLIFCIFFLLAFNIVNSQTVNLKWVKQFGGLSQEIGKSIAIDAQGNTFTVGYFNGTADFDPGTGVSNLVSAGSMDVFVTKLDASGNFLWARRMGGADTDYGYSVATDVTGNVFIGGFFNGTADFDNGGGAGVLTAIGSADIFICQLDANGGFVWVKQFGGPADEVAYSITLDPGGNIYTTGYFIGTVDFDPGPNTTSLTSSGISDVFIVKLDPTGNLVWAKQMGGIQSDIANAITLDLNGNVYTTGSFSNTADFNPSTSSVFNLNSNGANDIFIVKLDQAGDFLWAKQMGADTADAGYAVKTDKAGNVYTCGYFMNSVDFNPGAGTAMLSSGGSYDIFISKLNSSGNFIWAKSFGSSGTDNSFSITLDDSSNVYSTGYFQGTVDFDPGSGTANQSVVGGFDVFISRLDSAGNYRWAKQIGGTGTEQGFYISCDANRNLFLTGSFSGTVDFDPGTAVSYLPSIGGNDAYLLNLEQVSGTGINKSFEDDFKININPNPASSLIRIDNLDLAKGTSYNLYNSLGQVVISGHLENTDTIDISKLNNGLYYLELSREANSSRTKFIKQ
jgi:hypothetical protein